MLAVINCNWLGAKCRGRVIAEPSVTQLNTPKRRPRRSAPASEVEFRRRERLSCDVIMTERAEFQEIGHSGGQVIIRVGRDEAGRRSYQLEWRHCRPVRAAMFAVYALPQGIVVCQMELGGIGHPSNPPPYPGCFRVFIGSDSEGMFGHQCPVCQGYWRGDCGLGFCPYCGIRAPLHQLLTTAQRSYVTQFCEKMREALSAENDGEYVVDMDAVADAVGKSTEKPPFYYAEMSQQNRFKCNACGGVNDILGTFGYCSVCSTRNDLQELSDKIVPLLRNRIKAGGPYEACLRDSVSAFDSFVGRFVEQLVHHVPMTPARKARLQDKRFQKLNSVATELKEIFDIDILDGVNADDVEFAKLMFHRRHVYEHRGGEADEKYIVDRGDNSVRPKQALRESVESPHRIVGLLLRMATNLYHGFHEILPVEKGPILRHERSK